MLFWVKLIDKKTMIPRIVHYCWFGKGQKPQLVEQCIASWHRCMPDWTYMEWSEDNFAIASAPLYVRQAYEARKYAFVSDYVRLWALEQYGGVYLDVDFEVYKSFEPLLDCPQKAFVGKEGGKHQPPMLGEMASEPHSRWVTTMLHTYDKREFVKSDSSYDMTTNVAYFAAAGVHKEEWVKIYPVTYFCPILTTGEDVRNENTYCEHKGLHSWSEKENWKGKILSMVSPNMKIRLIKLKRRIFG